MMKEHVFFDIVLPTYKRAYCLKRAIDSICRQTMKRWHLWIVDDGPSRDGTEEIVSSFLGLDARISYLKIDGGPKGVSFARNKAISLGVAPYIALLDSDDEWFEQKLELQLEYFLAHPEMMIVQTEEIWIRKGRRVNPKKKHAKVQGDFFERSLDLCLISPSAVAFKRELLNEIPGPFREDFAVCEDYDLWLKILAKYPVGLIEKAQVAKYGGHEDQLSRKFKAMDEWRSRSMKDLYCSDWGQTYLDGKKKKALLKALQRKATILITGYRKHGKMKHCIDSENMLNWAQQQYQELI